jgi:hypothetical protein
MLIQAGIRKTPALRARDDMSRGQRLLHADRAGIETTIEKQLAAVTTSGGLAQNVGAMRQFQFPSALICAIVTMDSIGRTGTERSTDP